MVLMSLKHYSEGLSFPSTCHLYPCSLTKKTNLETSKDFSCNNDDLYINRNPLLQQNLYNYDSHIYENCKNMSDLEYACSGYDITELSNSDVPSKILSVFSLTSTSIEVLRNHTFHNKTIQTIQIQQNSLLITIESSAFNGVIGLKQLFLDDNHIHLNGLPDPILQIPNLFVPFRTLTGLEILNLRNNDIRNDDLASYLENGKHIPEILPCLKELDLSGNSLAFVDSCIFLPLRCSQLTHLSIANTDLSSSYGVSNGK